MSNLNSSDAVVLSNEKKNYGITVELSLLISFEIMLNFAQNSRFKFTECLFNCITTPSSLVSRHLSIFESLALIKFLPSLVVFKFTLCKFLFLLIPFSNTIGHTYYVCATFCIDTRIKFCLLAFCCPKSLSARLPRPSVKQ